nr:glycosyl hydrolase [Motilibacter aurantiacus]
MAGLLAVVPGSAQARTSAKAAAVVQVSPKKGVAATTLASRQDKLAALGATWSYNWTDSGSSASGVQFVPMVWGAATAASAAQMGALASGARAGRYKELLGFNEPDHADQADLTPEQALALWPKLQATGLRLGSPAVANYWGGWLDRFMSGAQARGYRVDFVTLHFYPDFTDPSAPDQLMAMVEDAWVKWRKPVWVTEVGAIDVSAWGLPALKQAPTDERADAFLRAVAQRLEQSPYVERYAWFLDTSADASCRWTRLYAPDGSLTSHGAAFAGVGRATADPRVGTFAVTARDGQGALHATAEAYGGYADTRRVVTTPVAWRGPEQRWAVSAVGDGTYRISSTARSGLVLQATGEQYGGYAGAAQVALTPRSWDLPEQRWRIVDAGGGYVRIVNARSGAALQATSDTYDASGEVRSAAVTPAGWNSSQQLWKLTGF